MTSNLYAKSYRAEPRTQKNEEFAFISYMDEPNSYSVVSIKRLIDVDNFRKGYIREKNKNYRIIVERTGTLVEMEQLAKEAEKTSTYKMNTDVVSDTEEWHKRKKVETKKNQKQPNVLDKQLTELDSFDFDENRTYTTLTTCVLDDLNVNVAPSRVSSDDDESDEDSDDEQQQDVEADDQQDLTPALVRKLLPNPKKRVLPTTSRKPSTKRLRKDNISSPIDNQDKLDTNQSSFSIPNELNNNFIQLRKQVAGLTSTYDQHKQLLHSILANQKKMAKAMRTHQIPILLSEETTLQASTTTNNGSIIYEHSNGEQIDLLKIPANRDKPNKFVLNALDQIFKNEKDLIDIDPHHLDMDNRITIIRDAVETKFGLSSAELATVWEPMLESIKSKRRNVKAKIRKSAVKPNENDNSSDSGNQSTSQ